MLVVNILLEHKIVFGLNRIFRDESISIKVTLFFYLLKSKYNTEKLINQMILQHIMSLFFKRKYAHEGVLWVYSVITL